MLRKLTRINLYLLDGMFNSILRHETLPLIPGDRFRDFSGRDIIWWIGYHGVERIP